MKHCPICDQDKQLVEFNKNSTKSDGLQTNCRECSRARSKRHYRDNRTKYKEIASNRKNRVIRENLAYMRKYLESHPCVDCNETDIRVLEFDHVRGKKRASVYALTRNSCSLETLIAEIGKCEIRCANDHRRRTFVDTYKTGLVTQLAE